MTEDPANCKAFATGAVRSKDADGVRYDLISPVALEAIAETYAEGAAKYGDNNWQKGMPVSDLLNHAIRHVYLFLGGDRSEPHLAHATWNLMAAIHSYKEWPHLNTNLVRRNPPEPPENDGRPRELFDVKEDYSVFLSCSPSERQNNFSDFLEEKLDCVDESCTVEDPKRQDARSRITGIPAIDEFRSQAPHNRNPSTAPVLYLSGPMSGHESYNFPAFKDAADKLRSIGYNVLDPSDFGTNPGETWEDCLARDLGCVVHAHVMVMLPGWEESRGARLEHSTATGLNKAVLELDDLLD
jgi:hypothetical protein